MPVLFANINLIKSYVERLTIFVYNNPNDVLKKFAEKTGDNERNT